MFFNIASCCLIGIKTIKYNSLLMLINFLRGNISIGDDHGDEFDNFEFGSDHFTDEDGDEWNNEEDDWDDDVHDEW